MILYRVTNGIKKTVKGLPPVYLRGQGGLLDIAISPNYKDTKEVYFTMSSEIDTYNISLINKSISEENSTTNQLIQKAIKIIRKEYPFVFNETLEDFIETFKDELKNGDDPIEKFQLFLDVNYYPDIKDENDLNKISELSSKIDKTKLQMMKNYIKKKKS